MNDNDDNDDKIKEQNRKRAKTYYDKNKDTINQCKKEQRSLLNQVVKLEEEKVELISGIKKPIVTQFKLTNNESLIDNLDLLDLVPSTLKKYKEDLKRLFKILDNEALLPKLKKPNEVNNLIEKITEANYKINTKKGMVQACLFIITRYNINVKKDAVNILKNNFELLKIKSNEVSEEKKKEIIPTWNEYLTKVKDKFGEDSKMYLITRMYYEVPVRDDFQLNIKYTNGNIDNVIKSFATNINYLILNKEKSKLVGYVIINSYKTQNKYGIHNKNVLSMALTEKIKSYIAINKLKENDYLFGTEKLTNYLSKQHKKIGVTGGCINLYRNMTVTDNDNLETKEKIELATKMNHSFQVHNKYLRTNKPKDESEK